MATMLQKVNASEELRSAASGLADVESLSASEPVLATPAAVAAGVTVTAAAFGGGIAVSWAVND
ncbi:MULTISPECIES: hypothetical protein [unclassified Streptomyces]|uniref:hypothetical protein n=1 Tax=unclassified Streptomyces TaxID=2593676 RepID=UPI003FD00B08